MHHKRDVSTCRPMHITQKLVAGLPSLRQGWIRERLFELLHAAVPRGLRTVAVVSMTDHIHLICIPESRRALGDAMRYVFSQLARALKKAWGIERGSVFAERFYSGVGRSVRQGFHMINYVLRNAATAGLVRRGAVDRFAAVSYAMLDHNRFLLSRLGPRRADASRPGTSRCCPACQHDEAGAATKEARFSRIL